MEQLINCVILDDEPLAVQLLQDYAGKISSLNLLYAGGDVYEAVDLLKTNPVDLIFIDLQMPELTGMQIIKMFNTGHNFIITSAYQEYALDSFQYNVIDFLVKPINFERFHRSVQKYLNWQQSFASNTVSDHFFIKSDRKICRVELDSILYIEGLKDYIRIHTTEDKLIAHKNMKDLDEQLPAKDFLRIHRSYIISVNKIVAIEGSRISIQNGEKLPIGETYRKKVAKRFNSRL